MQSSEASEGGHSDSVVNGWETLDNFSDSVDASLEGDSGDVDVALRVVLSLGDLVVALVGLEESNNSLGAFLALDLLGRETNGAG